MKLKLQKCEFRTNERKCLGFIINKNGVKPDIDKVELLISMPESRTVRAVRGFMGTIGYHTILT